MSFTENLLGSEAFREAKRLAWNAIEAEGKKLQGVKGPSSPEASARLKEELARYTADRGRELYFPFLAAGLGWGPFIELRDGSVKYDLIAGIGVHFFGHSHPRFVSGLFDSSFRDVMESNLAPSEELARVYRGMIELAASGSRLKHFWSTCSGTMANEVALRLLRAKKTPATRVFAFEGAFAGRSTSMLEITDNPKYREGQPTYGEVKHLPFYDPSLSTAENLKRTISQIDFELARAPGKYCALMTELVQGEGGFLTAPREWFAGVFTHLKKNGIYVWLDEIQTFARTGEAFAFQALGLEEHVDLVTVGKALQMCGVLYSEELSPKGLLLGGTFASSGSAARAANEVITMLKEDRLLGKDGKIARLSAHFRANLDRLANGSCKGKMGQRRIVGGMIAFQAHSGSADDTKRFLLKLFANGAIAFYNGHDPHLVRLLPPLPCMEERHIDEITGIIERTFLEGV